MLGRTILCQTAKYGETIKYGELAEALGLKSPRQQWNTVLNPISIDEVRATGVDLTLIVVYASGPAKNLSRYFSNIRGGQTPQTTMLDPRCPKQVAAYRKQLQKVFNTYANLPC